jgi:hypothetical protein
VVDLLDAFRDDRRLERREVQVQVMSKRFGGWTRTVHADALRHGSRRCEVKLPYGLRLFMSVTETWISSYLRVKTGIKVDGNLGQRTGLWVGRWGP